MAAAEMTEAENLLSAGRIVLAKVPQVTQNDWVIFNAYKGVKVLAATLIGGTDATFTPVTLTVNNTGTAYTATTTSIVYDGATGARSDEPFYVMTDEGEIIEVVDGTPTTATGTLTVKKRGCFGTTAAADGVANNDVLYALNAFLLADSQTSPVMVAYVPLSDDPGATMF